MTQKRKRGPSKRKPKQRPSRNYWDKDGNLAQIIDPEDPQAKEGMRNIAVMAWHSISCIRLDMFSTAHTALSQLDLHGDPEGARAVIDCVQSYILDIQKHLDDHLEDLKCALNERIGS